MILRRRKERGRCWSLRIICDDLQFEVEPIESRTIRVTNVSPTTLGQTLADTLQKFGKGLKFRNFMSIYEVVCGSREHASSM